MESKPKPISWVNAAKKEYDKFPKGAQIEIATALDIAAEGKKANITKPLRGFGSGVFEIALKYQSDAYRVVYAIKIGD